MFLVQPGERYCRPMYGEFEKDWNMTHTLTMGGVYLTGQEEMCSIQAKYGLPGSL